MAFLFLVSDAETKVELVVEEMNVDCRDGLIMVIYTVCPQKKLVKGF